MTDSEREAKENSGVNMVVMQGSTQPQRKQGKSLDKDQGEKCVGSLGWPRRACKVYGRGSVTCKKHSFKIEGDDRRVLHMGEKVKRRSRGRKLGTKEE